MEPDKLNLINSIPSTSAAPAPQTNPGFIPPSNPAAPAPAPTPAPEPVIPPTPITPTRPESVQISHAWSWVLVLILVALMAGAGGYYLGSRPGQSPTAQEEQSAVATSTFELVPYTNSKLGFSIDIPKDATVAEIGNAVSIRPANDMLGTTTSVWNIRVEQAETNAKVDAFIKSAYGSKCQLFQYEPTSVNGLYKIQFGNDDPRVEKPEDGCFINWITVLLYDENTRRIAQWNIGQDSIFGGADIDMSDSFRFLATSTPSLQ